MKRSLIIMTLFALCLTFNQAHAQRYLPGMKALQITAGMADGVHWNDNTDFAYHIGAAYSIYTKNANRWVLGGEYLEKRYNYKDIKIPVQQFTAEGGTPIPIQQTKMHRSGITARRPDWKHCMDFYT